MVARLLLSTLRHVAALLNREGVSWAVAGGVALSVWDHIRYTKDADFLIRVDDQDIEKLLVAFRGAGLRAKHDPPILSVGDQRFAQFIYQPDDTDFDIQVDFLFAEHPFQRDALARRVATDFPEWDTKAYVLGCEDLIVLKLVAGRIIDQADVAALLRSNRDGLDFNLLRKECEALNLSAALSRLWSEAFPDTSMPGSDA